MSGSYAPTDCHLNPNLRTCGLEHHDAVVPMQDPKIDDELSDGSETWSSGRHSPLPVLPPQQHQQPGRLTAARSSSAHTSQSVPMTCSLQSGYDAGVARTAAASPAAQQPAHSDDAGTSPVPRSRQRRRLQSPPPDASALKRSRQQVSNAQACLQPWWSICIHHHCIQASAATAADDLLGLWLQVETVDKPQQVPPSEADASAGSLPKRSRAQKGTAQAGAVQQQAGKATRGATCGKRLRQVCSVTACQASILAGCGEDAVVEVQTQPVLTLNKKT
jgi:hypothetical protein